MVKTTKTKNTRARRTVKREGAPKSPKAQTPKRINTASTPVGKTLSQDVINFIEQLPVPEGALLGKTIKLLPFQKKFLADVFDRKVSTRTAILSVARKNGKTTLIAGVCLAYLLGCLAEEGLSIVCGANSREQAGMLFLAMVRMINKDTRLQLATKITASKFKIEGLPLGTTFQAISANAKTAVGGSHKVVMLDELGQVSGARCDIFDALITGQSAHKDPITFIFSTQARSDDDFLSILIDTQKEQKNERTVLHLYEATPQCALNDEAEWHKANPALAYFRNMDDMRILAGNAEVTPAFEGGFRNLYLNQRVQTTDAYISPEAWRKCLVSKEEMEHKFATTQGLIFGGLDLSESQDLTAFAIIKLCNTGDVLVRVKSFMPSEAITKRARNDKAPYEIWHKAGELIAIDGAFINYAQVGEHIKQTLQSLNQQVEAIGFDRRFMASFKRENEQMLPLELFVEVIQTYWGLAEGMREFENALLNGKLKVEANPVTTMAALSARVKLDANGKKQIVKTKSTSKIDALMATITALSVAVDYQNGKLGRNRTGVHSIADEMDALDVWQGF